MAKAIEVMLEGGPLGHVNRGMGGRKVPLKGPCSSEGYMQRLSNCGSDDRDSGALRYIPIAVPITVPVSLSAIASSRYRVSLLNIFFYKT